MINGSCCQCGLLCRCPVDYIRNKVLDKNKTRELWSGCTRALFSDADRYCLKFPINMSLIFRILVLTAAILIDYRHFLKALAGI